jgi:peptidoglycan hydrolase-like protein with peptidoglycan-binding domain
MVARILGGDMRGRLLKKGARGKTVRALQLYLRSQGHDIKADGIFGDNTLAALKGYQKAAGLATDGKAGVKTFGAIRKGIEGGQVTPRPRPYGVSEVDQMDMAAAHVPEVMAEPSPINPINPIKSAGAAPPPDIMRGANSPLLDPNVAEYQPEPQLAAPDFGGVPQQAEMPQQTPATYGINAPGDRFGAMSGMGNAFSNAGGVVPDALVQALRGKVDQQNAIDPNQPPVQGSMVPPQYLDLIRALTGAQR